ncbi:copper homeostasis periplasmic binding protein CopC [Budvicia diplopodorum]|uniref:copper homeostasis periplasmic binding protein CopC n=1 Tax=Budvicia diplopodorum TaxID=1119056 RepID=UPI00135A0AF3|nr:copper homeostasis periplasmic binding protein CopC [Budvicia diplopodorum]
MTVQQLHKTYRTFVFLLVMIFGFSSLSVMAHAHLERQSPAAEATVAISPTQISLKFSEGIELKFSKINLLAEDNTPVNTGDLNLDSKDNTHLIAPITTKLTAGKYHVGWSVVSIDGHKTKGSYSFTIKP